MDIENGIEADPPIDYVVRGTEGPEVETSPAWPVPGMSEEVLYLRAGDTPNQGMLSDTPPPDAEPSNRITNVYAAGFNDGLQAVAQDSLLPGIVPRNTAAETAVYSLALPEGLQITGTPRVSLAARPSAHQVQYAAKLYEIRPDGSRALVTRGIHTTFDEILAPARVEFDLFSTSYRFAPGSTLELAVANSDVGYVLPSPVPSTTEIRHAPDAASWLQLPVVP